MRPSFLRAIPLALLITVPSLHARNREAPVVSSRFFDVDVQNRRVLGPAAHVPDALRLMLVSVTTDQPQYWPHEKVFLKIMMPGRGGAKVLATWRKRDANTRDTTVNLDESGVAVLTLLDGAQRPLEAGEYRVDVRTEDGGGRGEATFSVVEGSLGALSLAHEFKQVTQPQDLEREEGAWFLGNAAGAGMRWGNGLSFKNELRVGNHPYHGEVELVPRCMLPGCNGIQAGPSQRQSVKEGKVAGTLDVGGHSGPFQLEVITPKGSLRHQFEGSSHVERDMVQVSGGVRWLHRAGLAPYENTTQVPGRQLFVDRQGPQDDPLEVESVIAHDGKITLGVLRDLHAPMLLVYTPKADGTFASRSIPVRGDLRKGQRITIPVEHPYVLVTVAGFEDQKLHEGWTLGFMPAQLNVALDVPTGGAPNGEVPVELTVRGHDGKGLAVSGILEAYDNRVASRSPFSALASAIGESVRNTSSSVSSWVDHTGISEREEMDAPKEEAPSKMFKKMGAPPRAMPAAPPPPGAPAPSSGAVPEQGADRGALPPTDVIRQGEKKVVACTVVRTDASGKARVQVALPPQTGRVVFRFVAVRGLDHAAAQRDVDVTRQATVEAQIPTTFVPGANLKVPVDIHNGTPERITLSASGAGLTPSTHAVNPGHSELTLPWSPREDGVVVLQLTTANGTLLDRREIMVHSVAAQPVTWSRLEMGTGKSVSVGPEETAVVYAGPGALMRGMVTNVVTTMESWFGHAEALSAQAVVRAVLLAAASRGIIDDDGELHTIRMGLEKTVRDLEEAFQDPATGLIRPYPGMPGNLLWSAWVSRNLHAAVRTLKAEEPLAGMLVATIKRADALAGRLDRALQARQFSLEEQGGYDAQGRDVIPVEIEGRVAYRVVTDPAVTTWVVRELLPRLDWRQENAELAFSRAYDTWRFLRAFQRVGALQYLTEAATALWLQGEREHFNELYTRIARGMILAQDPGMLQGPALLGGVYSTPMALVRFLELLLLMARESPTGGKLQVQGPGGMAHAAMGEHIHGPATLIPPAGSVVRRDTPGSLRMEASARPGVRVELTSSSMAMGRESTLSITLPEGKDPLEYYALVAVPSTTAVKQSEDVLSDDRGQLILGQQSLGASKVQLLAVPFRGTRTMRLLLEGAYPGVSPGLVVVRHMENSADILSAAIPDVTVP
ncbi:MAG: hypothetical protein AB2A00_24760 [Myxococcota bacterium]